MSTIKIAAFKLTSCSGCLCELVDTLSELVDRLSNIEIACFPLVKDECIEGPYDVVFVEGSVASSEDIEKIYEIRQKSKILVALGSCACFGGPQSIGNDRDRQTLIDIVYGVKPLSNPVKSYGIDEYVKVDIYIPGCPVCKEDIIEVLRSVTLGIKPRLRTGSVCVDCKIRENECFLLKGIPCLGPITRGGCGAICPSYGKPCTGCRGPTTDINYPSLVETLRELKLKREDIVRLFKKFGEWRGVTL